MATPPVTYSDGNPPNDLFTPGATLTISAAGEAAGVPAFTGDVITPGPLANVTFPASISRGATPTIVTYTAGTSDEVWGWVLALGAGGGTDLVFCRTTDTGSFTFPAAALGMIPAADAQGLMILWRTNANSVTAGSMSIALTAGD